MDYDKSFDDDPRDPHGWAACPLCCAGEGELCKSCKAQGWNWCASCGEWVRETLTTARYACGCDDTEPACSACNANADGDECGRCYLERRRLPGIDFPEYAGEKGGGW